MALPAAPVRQPAAVHHIALGDAIVSVVNDGMFEANLGIVVGIEPAEAASLQQAGFRDDPPRLTVNAFLLRSNGKLTLIDTGCGNTMGPTLGTARANLQSVGVTPDMIDTVLLTHFHPDHLGGLIDAEGRATYPRAELVFAEAEAEFWLDDGIMSRAPDDVRPYFEGARAAIAPYADRTRRIAAGAVQPGVTAMALPGHTPGHTGYMIEAGSERLLIWGDIVHMPGIQFASPAASMAFDTDQEAARATRERTFDMAATDRLLIAGMHLDFPTFGHVVRAGAGYQFVPHVWTPGPAGPVAG
jgi:glyoxylase-like metal-dependent hydrolase (beta-lactamase superfamily II)